MPELLLLIQLVSTLAMVGLIWFVQVVHYPLFASVGESRFRDYERLHQQRTTMVVAPLMIAEALTALAFVWIRPAGVTLPVAICGLLLVGLLWMSTYFWQVPAHRALTEAFDAATHRKLVRSNWIRTIGWTLRGALVCWMTFQFVANFSY